MNPVNSVTTNGAAATPPKTAGRDLQLTRDDFMTLMLAQIQNQNPLNPTDGTEYMAQMAQMTQVSELANLNTRVDELIASQNAMMSSQSTQLIGREITAQSDSLTVGQDGHAAVSVTYPGTTSGGILKIVDGNGGVVQTVQLPAGGAGEHAVNVQLPPGTYTMSATIESGETNLAVPTAITGVVSGVDFSSGVPLLQVGIQQVSLGDVISVEESRTTES